MEAPLSASGLNIGYTQRRGATFAVHTNINLELCSGKVTALLGLNGAGKSTLLRTLCGFQPSLGGEIKLLGRNIGDYAQSDISKLVGVVLTEKSTAGGISVYDLVALGRYPYTGFFGELSADDRAIIEESLSAVGIAHKAQNHVAELSDGERQKAMIAKALAQQCPIIVLDEPTAFLDVISRVEVMVLLRRLAHEQGKTILLSTHDLDTAIQMCDWLWLLQKGESMRSGTPAELIASGDISKFFSRGGVTFDTETLRFKY